MTINISITSTSFASIAYNLDFVAPQAIVDCVDMDYDLSLDKYKWVGVKFTSFYPLSVTLYCSKNVVSGLFDVEVTAISITDLNESNVFSRVFNICTLDREDVNMSESVLNSRVVTGYIFRSPSKVLLTK